MNEMESVCIMFYELTSNYSKPKHFIYNFRALPFVQLILLSFVFSSTRKMNVSADLKVTSKDAKEQLK